ncbi:MAG TPA: hypothetical protein VFD11_09255 [Thiopseudomonas sp.]|nr:hypothetical protein [Thiopseudomonas sp.]
MAPNIEQIPLAPHATTKVILGEQILSEPHAAAMAQSTERILLARLGIIKAILGALTHLEQSEAVMEQPAVPTHLAQCAATECFLLDLKAVDEQPAFK